MAPRDDGFGRPGRLLDAGVDGRPTGRSAFARYAARRPGLLIAAIVCGFVGGDVYRLAFDPAADRTLLEFLRSGLHGAGLGLTVWVVRTASGVGAPLGEVLRRLPLAVEVVLRSLVMTVALLVVGVALQIALFAELDPGWVEFDLTRIVAVTFALSMIFDVVIELERLIGGPMLMSALLGAYHRPTRRRLIVMFLDMANSTRLAEAMGEVRVHDLITRFFFDIDEPIADFGGSVHAYVGDEVIVSWAVSDDPGRNGCCVGCFDAIERKIAALAPMYEAEFGVVPTFRAGIHAGPVVVSECGDAKRQLAFFGDTMNVAARLCEYGKAVGARLVISGDLANQMTVPQGFIVGEAEAVEARGRRERVGAHRVQTPSEGKA